MKVTICTPHGGDVPPEYYRSILLMENHNLDHQFYHLEVDVMIIGKARNMLVQTALAQTDADIFWFVDNDTLPPLHSGQLLEKAHELGIVSGVYFSRRPPYTPQMYRSAAGDGHPEMYWPIIDYPSDGMMVVDAVGGGCLAVRRDVFEHMKTHYDERVEQAIEDINHALRNKGAERKEFEWLTRYAKRLSPWFEFLDRKGEDLYFCERAREAGYTIWVDLDVKCEHLARVPINEGHFSYLKDNDLIKIQPVGQPGIEGVDIEGAGTDEEGAEDNNEDPTNAVGRAEGMERRDDIPRTVGGLGKRSDIPGSVTGPKES